MENEIEEWRSVVGFEGQYEVSSLGRVRSLDRVLTDKRGRRRRLKGKILKLQKRDEFYWSVTLGHEHGSERVHAMVARAWHGDCPVGLVTRHLDCDGYNNKPHNLTYGTPLENSFDNEFLAIENDCFQRKDGRLKPSEVAEIKSLLGAVSQRELARMYGVSRGCITGIHRGVNWPNVKTANSLLDAR
jgi:DNA-binding XRE family transcriptional regulator